jgi:predicted PurR-regulated permease PerM
MQPSSGSPTPLPQLQPPLRGPARPPGSDLEFIARSMRRFIVIAVIAIVVLALLWALKAALTPLAIAFLFAYLLDPVIDRIESWGVPRRLAILMLLGTVVAVLIGSLLGLIPMLQRDIAALVEQMPVYLERLREQIPLVERRFGIHLPRTLNEVLQSVNSGEVALPLDAMRTLLGQLILYATGTIAAFIGFLVIPILAYYALVEFDKIVPKVASWFPPRHRERWVAQVRMVDHLVSSFVRGQLLVAGCLGLLYAIGFSWIGIDLAVGVGLLAGAMALVPYLGNVVAVSAASILCLLKFGIDGHLAAVVGWYVFVQILEGFVLTPRIVGQSVGLHPAAVIVALLIGGDLFGFFGLLIAVPLAAVVKVFAGELLEQYQESALYGDQAALPELRAPEPLPETTRTGGERGQDVRM